MISVGEKSGFLVSGVFFEVIFGSEKKVKFEDTQERNLSKILQKLYQKRQKLQNVRHIHGQFEAVFFDQLNLSRDGTSPKQQTCLCLRRFNILVHEVYRCFDKN